MLCQGRFNQFIIIKAELFYQTAAPYSTAYLLILSIIILNFRVVIAGGWWNFLMPLKNTIFSGQTIIKFRHRNTVRKLCRNTGFLWSVFSSIWTESYPYFFSGKIRIWFGPYMGKYRSEKAGISAFFTKWSPREGVLILSKVVDWRPVTLTVDLLFGWYFTEPMTRKHLEDFLSRSANNAKQSSNEYCFCIGKAL